MNMIQDIQEQVARALVEINAVGFAPDAPIRFKSGILSPIYIDNRCLPYYPEAWRVVVQGFQTHVEHQKIEFDVLAGVAVGGVPHSSALAFAMKRPSVFVRKEAKGHGKQKLVEGGDVGGRRVLLVEDLVTTGGSSLTAVEALRQEGAVVTDLLAIVSYEFEEARIAFQEATVQLSTLTNFQVIVQAAKRAGKLKSDAIPVIQDWFDDPHGWGARHGHE
jgi:orotate phosphoribosyltransferase